MDVIIGSVFGLQVGGGPGLLRGGEADAAVRQRLAAAGRHGHDGL